MFKNKLYHEVQTRCINIQPLLFVYFEQKKSKQKLVHCFTLMIKLNQTITIGIISPIVIDFQ